jgi:uncharacterized Zn finger protein
VRAGVKLRSRDGEVPREGLPGRWLRCLERLHQGTVLLEGLEYARVGQIVSLEARLGAVRARVQGRGAQPYETRIGLDRFTTEQWERIIAAMAGEAVYLVKLLAGEMPESIDVMLSSIGCSLLPGEEGPMTIECTCDAAGPCKHSAAVAYVFAEQLAREPLLVCTLRGLPADQLLERLRQARTLNARGVMAAHADPMIPVSQVEPAPLDDCLRDYWRAAASLDRLRQAPPVQHVSHALLRRLGPSPLQGKFPLVGLLASVYDSVSEHAVRLRNTAEHLDEQNGD